MKTANQWLKARHAIARAAGLGLKARHVTARAACLGLKARDVTARAEGPGSSASQTPKPCKGETITPARRAIGRRAGRVPPLQGGEKCFWVVSTRGFTPGCHIAPLQGFRTGLNRRFHHPRALTKDFRFSRLKARHVIARAAGLGLKARHVIARAEGPGSPSPQTHQAL